jgi:hypothetical protein
MMKTAWLRDVCEAIIGANVILWGTWAAWMALRAWRAALQF